jgi:hypothetical protein
MASEHQRDQQAAEQDKKPKDSRTSPPSQPSPPSGPPLLNDGPEPIRSSDC